MGRLNKKEVVLKKIFFEKLKEFNPNLPEQAYNPAYEKLTDESITKSLAENDKQKVEQWSDKPVIAAAVFNYVSNTLF